MSAVEAMFRMRAVESPPDASGVRRIWHRGRRGAELVTLVDAQGQIVQHDLTLFDDVVRWDRDRGFRHSRVEPGSIDGPADRFGQAGDELLARFRDAVENYSGTDRFIQHLRELLRGSAKGLLRGEGPPRSPAKQGAVAVAEPVKSGDSKASQPWLLVVLVVAGVLMSLGLVALWWS